MIRYHARWVAPVTGPPVRDGTVVVDETRIHWVGQRPLAPAIAGATDVDLGDAVLIPGLVNAHVHLDLSLFAGLLRERAFFPWIRAIARASAEAMDNSARLVAATWGVIDQMEHGVTTFADTSPGRAAFDAMQLAGARGVAFLETFGPDPAHCDTAFADLRARVETVRAGETQLVRIGVSPHAPYSVSDALYRAVADYARTESLPVAVHIAESSAESELVAHGRGEFAEFLRGRRIPASARAATPIALIDRQRVLATRPLCIHAVHASHDDALRLADNGAAVAHCPLSNRWFGHGQAPIDAFRAHHVRIGLGTDSAASNDEVRVLSEAVAVDGAAWSPADRLALATRGGAEALDLPDGTGTLTPGAPADLTAFAVADTALADRDPEAYVLEQCASRRAKLVVVNGAERVRDGRAVARDRNLDETVMDVRTALQSWADAAGWPRA